MFSLAKFAKILFIEIPVALIWDKQSICLTHELAFLTWILSNKLQPLWYSVYANVYIIIFVLLAEWKRIHTAVVSKNM